MATTQSTPETEYDELQREMSPVERRLNQGLGLFVGTLALAMVALPVVQALGRKLFDADIPSASVMVQHLTLWVGFLGALLAAGSGKHLALSTVEAIPEGWPRRTATLLRRITSSAVAALLAYASWKVVQADAESGRTVVASLPVSWSEAVMPFAFGAMALRFAWRVGKGPQSWVDRGVALVGIGLAFALGAVAPTSVVVAALMIFVAISFLSGAPVFVIMGASAMVLFWADGVPIAAVPAETFRLVSSATLPAIPLLTVAGYVLAEGGAAKRLVTAYKGFFGWMPGGVAIMATVVCAVFTTFTGGSGVTILALGGLLVPMMVEEKYPEGFSHGLVTSAGSLGLLFPPSLPVILYSVVAGVPVAHLFLGGAIPGVLMMALVAAYGIYIGVKHKIARPPFKPGEAMRGLWAAKWDLGLPTVVIVTVITGFGTIVEASALGCAYAMLVEIVIFRTIHPVKDLPRVMITATTLVGAVVILLGVAMGLSSWLVDAEIPTALLEWTTTHIKSPWIFLLVLNIGLLIFGSVLEIYAAIVVLAPLVAPIGAAYGIDPVHLGVIFLANLELGFLFPPMGLNLFLASTRFQKPLPYFYARTFPFLLILAVGVLLITYVEVMTTWMLRFAS